MSISGHPKLLFSSLTGKSNVFCFRPDDVPAEIEARSDIESGEKSQVRGYTVAVKQAYTSQTDLDVKRARIAHLLKFTK